MLNEENPSSALGSSIYNCPRLCILVSNKIQTFMNNLHSRAFTIVFCLLCLASSFVQAQISETRLLQIDSLVNKTPKPSTKKIETLSAYLGSIGTTDEEKAYAVFSWVAHHVKYDIKVFQKGYVPKCSAEEVLKGRVSVCQGYSELFKSLAEKAGLECKFVPGYSKGVNYRDGMKFREPDHAWNLVKYNEGWHLIDCTWASGVIANSEMGAKFTPVFNRFWFDPAPKLFLLSHFPTEKEALLVEQNITLEDFQKWPAIDVQFLQQLRGAETLTSTLLQESTTQIPICYAHKYDITYESIPLLKELSKEKEYAFKISGPKDLKLVLIDGKESIPFQKSAESFDLVYQPKSKKLIIAVTTDKSIDYLVEYKVSK